MKTLPILAIVLVASIGYSADYTISTTLEREAALKTIVDRINGPVVVVKEGDPKPPTPMTNADYLKARVNDLLDKYVSQEAKIAKDKVVEAIKQVSTDEATILLKYQKADKPTKAIVDEALKDVKTVEAVEVTPLTPVKSITK